MSLLVFSGGRKVSPIVTRGRNVVEGPRNKWVVGLSVVQHTVLIWCSMGSSLLILFHTAVVGRTSEDEKIILPPISNCVP